MPTIPALTTGYTLEEAEQDIADLRGQVDSMDEVLSLLDGPLPNVTPISGCQLFSANGQPNYVNFTGLNMSLQGAQPATFPGTTVTNTLTLQSLASFTIPANDADIGGVYELEIWGNGTWANVNTAVGSMGLQIVLGGNNLATVTLGGGFMLASTAFRIHVTGRAICHTTGATGAWTTFIAGECSINGSTLLSSGASSANATSGFVSCESTTTQAVDTTAAISLGISAAFGSATNNGTVTSRVAVAKRIC